MTMDEFRKYFTDFKWPWYMPTIKEYNKILKSFSFSELKVWGENADRLFPDKKAIIGWIDQPSIIPFITYIDDSKKEDFRKYVIDHMLQDTAQQNGGYFETFRRINIFARN